MMHHPMYQAMFGVVVALIMLGVSFRPAAAGDFMLVTAFYNDTIFAGSIIKYLDDLVGLPLQGVKGPLAVDYDPTGKMVYWTQFDTRVQASKLVRAHLDGSNQMTLVPDIRYGHGLALDVEARMVYWTNDALGQIGRVNMDGSGTKKIIVQGLDTDMPNSLVIDHSRGHIYWTDAGSNPKIERANLDGTNRMTIIEERLSLPQDVIIDFETNKLYWCDGVLDTIERSDLLGNNRELLINLTIYSPIHPYDLEIHNDYMYWSDFNYYSILRVHLNGRGEQNFGPDVFHGIGRIHIQKEPDFCDSSPCSNGATCDDVINGFVCQCPPGWNGHTCSETEHVIPVPIVIIAAGAGGGVLFIIIIIILIVVLVLVKKRKTRNRRERAQVQNIPVVADNRYLTGPPPAYPGPPCAEGITSVPPPTASGNYNQAFVGYSKNQEAVNVVRAPQATNHFYESKLQPALYEEMSQ